MNRIEKRAFLDASICFGLLAIVVLLIAISPFPEPINKISATCIAIATMAWGFSNFLRTTDEVLSSLWTFSAAIGAAVGLTIAMSLAVLIRFTPALAEALSGAASSANNPAVAGYAWGTAITICLFGISTTIVYVFRLAWMSRR